jgi:O-methyltransferase
MGIEQIIQYAIYTLLAIFIYLGIRYLWLSITQRVHHPEMWIYKKQQKDIPARILEIEKGYNDKIRLYNFWFQIDRILRRQIQGAFAELGVYKGESAEIIHQLAPNRDFYLFDTFSGFEKTDIETETGEAATYTESNFADTDLDVVKKRLGKSRHLIYRQGYFPATTKGMEEISFAFVNVDADLYKPVKASLEFFYPRLSPGGVMIIHDYTHKWEGLSQAIDEFAETIPEVPVHIPDRFGSVMIIKNRKN